MTAGRKKVGEKINTYAQDGRNFISIIRHSQSRGAQNHKHIRTYIQWNLRNKTTVWAMQSGLNSAIEQYLCTWIRD